MKRKRGAVAKQAKGVLAAVVLAGCFPLPGNSAKQPAGSGERPDANAVAGAPAPTAAPHGGGPGGGPSAGEAGRAVPSFVGRFEGEGLVLELVPLGSEVRGQLTVRGANYSARLRATAPDQARGTFVGRGRSFPLAVLSEGDGVVVESEGKTYRLVRAAPGEALAQWVGDASPEPRRSLAGDYFGLFEGHPVGLRLVRTGGRVQGDLFCAGRRYALSATGGTRLACGTLSARGGEESVRCELSVRGDAALDLALVAEVPGRGERRRVLRLQRVAGAAGPQPAKRGDR